MTVTLTERERQGTHFRCTHCANVFMWPACECDECGAYPLCSLCKKAHEEDGEHD